MYCDRPFSRQRAEQWNCVQHLLPRNSGDEFSHPSTSHAMTCFERCEMTRSISSSRSKRNHVGGGPRAQDLGAPGLDLRNLTTAKALTKTSAERFLGRRVQMFSRGSTQDRRRARLGRLERPEIRNMLRSWSHTTSYYANTGVRGFSL